MFIYHLIYSWLGCWNVCSPCIEEIIVLFWRTKREEAHVSEIETKMKQQHSAKQVN